MNPKFVFRLARLFSVSAAAGLLALGCSTASESGSGPGSPTGGAGAPTSAGATGGGGAGTGASGGLPPMNAGGSIAGSSSLSSGGTQGEAGSAQGGSAQGGGAGSGGSGGVRDSIKLPPIGNETSGAGRLEKLSFPGPISKRDVLFNVYFPAGYDSDTTRRYPVVYRLHGKTDSRDTRNDLITSNFEAALKKGLTCPFIIVFPEAMYNSFYADSKDGTKPVETQIIRELLPHVDASFRTIADARARVLYGWSMGGYGAMEYMTKFPELWSVAVGHDAGIRSWLGLDADLDVKQGIFGNDEHYYDVYSPFANLAKNADQVRGRIATRLVVAHWLDMNRTYRDLLKGSNIDLSYVEVACDHNEQCVVDAAGLDSWSFIYQSVKSRASQL